MNDHLKSAPVAYKNEPFLNSPDGRILRILAEYQEPLARFRREQIQDTVVFFGSARFQGGEAAKKNFSTVQKNEARAQAAEHEANLKIATAAVDMARYYEDARRLAFLLTKWAAQIPALPGLCRRRHRLSRRPQPFQIRRHSRRRLRLPPRRPHRTPPRRPSQKAKRTRSPPRNRENQTVSLTLSS